jgi:hypothetical protein
MDVQERLKDGSTYRDRTANLRQELEHSEGGVANAVLGVLASFKAHNIDLPLFLDYISYCETPAAALLKNSTTMHNARTALLYSVELPGILQRWHSRPAHHGRGMSSDTPGRKTMQAFAIEQVKASIDRELRDTEDLFKMKTSQLSRDTLLSIRIDELQLEVIKRAPVTWEIYRNAAWTSQQEKRNIRKSPDKVGYMFCIDL